MKKEKVKPALVFLVFAIVSTVIGSYGTSKSLKAIGVVFGILSAMGALWYAYASRGAASF